MAIGRPYLPYSVIRWRLRRIFRKNSWGVENLSEKEQKGIQIELRMVNERWGSERGHRVDKEKIPLLKSQEWVTIPLEKKIGRNEWREMEKAELWKCFADL